MNAARPAGGSDAARLAAELGKLDRSLNIEPVFRVALESAGRPQPQPAAEYRFHPTRRWRFDYAFPEEKVAVEVEGGAFIRGWHTRGAGLRTDLEKYSEAAAMGWWSFACFSSSCVPNARSDGSVVRWHGRVDARVALRQRLEVISTRRARASEKFPSLAWAQALRPWPAERWK